MTAFAVLFFQGPYACQDFNSQAAPLLDQVDWRVAVFAFNILFR